VPTLYQAQQFFVDPQEENLNPNGQLFVKFVENETQMPVLLRWIFQFVVSFLLLSCEAIGADFEVEMKTKITRTKQGVYDVTYMPEAAGSFQMTVMLDDAVVGESFLLNFPPNKRMLFVFSSLIFFEPCFCFSLLLFEWSFFCSQR
jgi:hypothetical protein